MSQLVEQCPFLLKHLDPEFLELPMVAFGSTARTLMARLLEPHEEDAVFVYFNELAERGDAEDCGILGTGAIELFNDNADAQRLARNKLTGRALSMLEEFRSGWGQPDYEAE